MTGILWAVLQDTLSVRPLYSEGSPHHATLFYGVERKAWEEIIGLPMTISGIGLAHDSRIQAIRVVLPTWCPCQNPAPHVTVSWQPGVQPVEANAMLAAGDRIETDFDLAIHTRIEFLEWSPEPQVRLCSVCGEAKLRSDNKTGVCSRCQRSKQPNSRYR